MTAVQKCALIQAGIDAMKAHANPECRLQGGLAQDRFDADSGTAGFRDQPPYQDKDMSVFTNPRDGYTNVHPPFWSNPYIDQNQATGALIAHEEKHHQGFGEDEAVRTQDACLNSQA